MSGPNYSNGIIGTFELDATDVQDFFDDVRTSLLTCLWTVVKEIPSSGRTTGYQFKSVATPGGTQILLNMFWDGSTMILFGYPIIKFEVDTLSETNTTNAGQVTITDGKRNRIICGPYQFFIFYDSTISPNPGLNGPFDRNDATGGIPFRMVDSGDAFWTLGTLNSWRYDLFRDQTAADSSLGFLIDGLYRNARAATVINPQLLSLRGSQLLEPTKFADLNFPIITPMLVLGLQSDPVVLSLWDAMVVGGFYDSKIVATADFRDWESFTIQGSESTCVGCLFLAIRSYAPSSVGSYAH